MFPLPKDSIFFDFFMSCPSKIDSIVAEWLSLGAVVLSAVVLWFGSYVIDSLILSHISG